MQYLQLLQLLHELIFLEVILTGLLPQLSLLPLLPQLPQLPLYRTLFSIYLLRTFSVPSLYQLRTKSIPSLRMRDFGASLYAATVCEHTHSMSRKETLEHKTNRKL